MAISEIFVDTYYQKNQGRDEGKNCVQDHKCEKGSSNSLIAEVEVVIVISIPYVVDTHYKVE